MSNELLAAALEYAAIGWHVFPLKPRGKSPAFKGWQAAATTDPATIRQWWSDNPQYNVGIKTGGGLCVVDVDDKPYNEVQGSDMLRAWELEHGDISETVTCCTPTGGVHYYYDIGTASVKSCKSAEICIDLRSEGGLIVAPPSIHPDTGTAYVWDVSPMEMKPAQAQANDRAFIQYVWDSRDHSDRDGQGFSAPEVVHKGARDRTLYEMACSMWAKSLPESTIRAALLDYNANYCVPPLPSSIVEQKLRSATGNPPGLSDEAKATQKKAKKGGGKFDHAGIARKLMEGGFCFIDGMPALFVDGRYQTGWQPVQRAIIDMDGSATQRNQKEVIHYLTIMGEQRRQSPPHLIAFKNGVLDINTKELREWRADDVIPNVIPHDWAGFVECPEVDAVLTKMACSDVDTFNSLIEVMGVCMYRSSEFTQSAILLGTGSNGKSTYIRMLQALLGLENVSSLDMSMLHKQFHTGHLAGKLANLGDDISNKFKDGDTLTVFKKAVDGNRLYADVKGIDGFEFEPYATMIFSCNEFPRLDDYTDGMMRRLFPIEFNAKFSKSAPDYDPQIARKLSTETACQRMAWLGVVGLERVKKANGFTPTAASDRRRDEILADNDTALAWLIDESENADTLDGKTTAAAYSDYRYWCDRNGLHAVSRSKFARGVKTHTGMAVAVAWRDSKSVRIFEKA